MQHALLLFFSCCCSFCMAQNLVPNGSFEEYSHCPIDAEDFSVIEWTSPTTTTPDYFNTCGGVNVGVPNNAFGTQNARTGSGYAGIIAYLSDYREYIQVPLSQTLLAGQKYYVSFYISSADLNEYVIKEFGAYFSSAEIHTGTYNMLSFIPQIQHYGNLLSDTIGWTNIKGSFVAEGSERYLIIGNFNNDQNTTVVQVRNDIHITAVYYYIDDVSVWE